MAARATAKAVDELEALKKQLAAQSQELLHREALIKEQAARIEKLTFEIARLRRWRFGKSAETLSAEQLALWECELDADIAQVEVRLESVAGAGEGEKKPRSKQTPKRRPLPDSLPRVEIRHDLASHACPDCGEDLERIGEEISEQLDLIPARFFVRRHVRPKYCCRHCESVHTAPLAAQPIDKGVPAPGLLAHVAINKFLDHQPLYRQESQFARLGVALPRSTLAGWLGQLEVLIEPLVERLIKHLFEVWEATKSPTAQAAIAEIGKLYEIERDLKGRPPDERRDERIRRAAPILTAFKTWLDKTYAKSPPRGELAKAIHYTLNRWKALQRYLADGMLAIDNNPVENAIRGIAVGRKNWLFAGSEGGGHRAALFYTLIETAKLNGIDPHAYIAYVLERLPSAKAADLDSMLPWNFTPQPQPHLAIA